MTEISSRNIAEVGACGPDAQRPGKRDAAVLVGTDGRARCAWGAGVSGASAEEYRRYHDEEWGVVLHGDRPLFEKLSLEGFQAGLSWITILRKRPAFRELFRGFEIDAVAAMGSDDVDRLMQDARIVRNLAKIEATISNARAVRELVHGHPGAFDELLWGFAPPTRPAPPRTTADVPAETPESRAASRALKQLGLRFVGPTTVYSLMQSAGMVDDHLAGCWRAR